MSYITSKVDPSDNLLKIEISKRENSKRFNKNYILEISKNFDFCIICCSSVNIHSKHCRICNKCVDKFDHHCNWLNNCIGKENYLFFIILLWICFLTLSYNIAIYSYAIFIYLNRNELYKNITIENSYFFNVFSLDVCFALTLINILINVVVIINIIYLILVHIWLRCRGLTTYEYIVKYNFNKDDKNEKELEKKCNKSENAILKLKHNFNFSNSNKHPENFMNSNIMNKHNNINLNLIELEKNYLNKKIIYKNIDYRNENTNELNKDNNKINFTKKGKNKIIPNNLIKKIQEIDNNINGIKIEDQSDKYIIDEKDYKEKIFKPIIDEIYNMNSKEDIQKLKNYDLNIIPNKLFNLKDNRKDLKPFKDDEGDYEIKNINFENNPERTKKKNYIVENILVDKEISDIIEYNISDSKNISNGFKIKKDLYNFENKIIKTYDFNTYSPQSIYHKNVENVSEFNNINFLRQSSIRDLNCSTFLKEK